MKVSTTLYCSVCKIQRRYMAYQATMQDENLRKGSWLEEEDKLLSAIVAVLGERRWDTIARSSGLRRSGKSCRLRWLNYLRPNLKHDPISYEEEQIILQLHARWGNKWAKIARRLPGRTDNEIKNYWRTHLRKKAQSQEQGNYPSFMGNAAEQTNYMIPKSDHTISTQNTCYQGCNISAGAGDVLGTADDDNSFDDLIGSYSNSAEIANSPYESRISDWVYGFSDDLQSGLSDHPHHEDCTSSGIDQYSCFYTYPSCQDDETSSTIWDCSGYLWDMD